jgi:cytochrome b6-f complex iron-sulfur subunit
VIPLAISSGTVAAIVIVLIVDLFAIFFGLSFVRARRAQRAAAGGPGLPPQPPARAPRPISRRDFFRRSWLASLGVFTAQFGAGTIAFLWPNLRGGFGAEIVAGKVSDIRSFIRDNEEPFYFGAGRFYIVEYQGKPSDEVDYQADGLVAEGLMPLYQRCVHLGCRVPFCASSQWFECPCHGSKYNTAGEYKLGPAPRGLDRFKIRIEGDDVIVDTSEIILGPPRGTDTLGKGPDGPFCVAPG